LVCVGLDSEFKLLPQCVRNDANPIYTFNKAIIDATKEFAAAYKPNLAFYLAAGVKGLEALKLTIAAIPEDVPVILDCKVGDIGNTMDAYLKAFFDEMGCDAITVNPLMGKDVIKMMLNNEKNFAFALALTSNLSAKDFMMQKDLYQDIAKWIKGFDAKQVGAVVGATQTEYLSEMRKLMPEQIFLIPGIGAQGGDLKAVLTNAIATKAEPNILINSSRGIIFKDNTTKFAETAALETEKLRDEIKKGIK
jgi:orotidine-5'-phosphate decarboxylase